MNLEEYFQRISFHGSYDTLDLATLKLIHKQHVMSIPFENLSIHCGEPVTMDLQIIFNKLVRSHRGGWCMENNLLFAWVLREMGYTTTTLGCRIFVNSLQDYSDAEEHLVNMVDIHGKAYLTDVSYGLSLQMWEPLELVSGMDQIQIPGTFRLSEKSGVWMLEKIARKPKIPNPQFTNLSLINKTKRQQIYSFTLDPRCAGDFSKTSHQLQTDPSSLFKKKSICSLQTAVGFKVLIGWTYSEVTYKPEEGVDVFDIKIVQNNEIEQVLREEFNVILENKLYPVHKKSCLTL